MKWLDGIINSMDTSLSKLLGDGEEQGGPTVHGVAKSLS